MGTVHGNLDFHSAENGAGTGSKSRQGWFRMGAFGQLSRGVAGGQAEASG